MHKFEISDGKVENREEIQIQCSVYMHDKRLQDVYEITKQIVMDKHWKFYLQELLQTDQNYQNDVVVQSIVICVASKCK